MAINLDDRYPGRANPKSLDYPQGSFKNRTSPTSKDGTYLEQDWANDWAGFFQRMMAVAGISPNGVVDTAESSQYFDALSKVIGDATPDASTTQKGLIEIATAAEALAGENDEKAITPATLQEVIRASSLAAMTMAQAEALTSDVGPIWVIERQDIWVWTETAHWEGYRSPRLGEPIFGPTLNPRPFEIDAVGQWIDETTYPGSHMLAYARENNLIVDPANFEPGNIHFARDSGLIRIADGRNMFLSWRAGATDPDTANARALGSRQLDAIQNITGSVDISPYRTGNNVVAYPSGAFVYDGAGPSGDTVSGATTVLARNRLVFDASRVARTGSETRGRNAAYTPRLHA